MKLDLFLFSWRRCDTNYLTVSDKGIDKTREYTEFSGHKTAPLLTPFDQYCADIQHIYAWYVNKCVPCW